MKVPLPRLNSAVLVIPQFVSDSVTSIEVSVTAPLPDITTSEHPLPSLWFTLMLKLESVSDTLVSVNHSESESIVSLSIPSSFSCSSVLTSTMYSLNGIFDTSLECFPLRNFRDSEYRLNTNSQPASHWRAGGGWWSDTQSIDSCRTRGDIDGWKRCEWKPR